MENFLIPKELQLSTQINILDNWHHLEKQFGFHVHQWLELLLHQQTRTSIQGRTDDHALHLGERQAVCTFRAS